MKDSELQILFGRYRDKIYGFFVQFLHDKELAADLMQDVFVKLIQSNTNISEIADLDGYIYHMCRHRAYDHLKKAYKDKEYRSYLLSFMHQEEESVKPEIEQIMEADHYREVLEQSLQQLPDQQRIIFNLSKREGLSHQKIAEILNLSPITVRNHLHRAMKNLRSITPHDLELVLLILAAAGLLSC
ncbi:MAG TPA: sigma-70 family RNA polymerase sigma factor [Membranihabitans sp.]|nr:sigma-70 family RNA polymerase sigma factor [Membranihabitans sp.]